MRRRRATGAVDSPGRFAAILIGALALAGAACGDPASPSDPASAASGGEGGGGASGAGGAGEGGDGVYDGPPIPWAHQPFPELDPAVEPPTPDRAALGRLLFYDPILSGDQATACLTCHSEEWGLGDGLPTSIGIHGEGPVGPGRIGGTATDRNAPTLWNVGLRGAFFWDGRSQSLEEQALEPLRSPIELGLDPDEAAARLAAVPEYVQLFVAAFPEEADPISPSTIARSLAALQRTFVSRNAPYDQYVGGDEGALDEETRLGMQLFAEAGCAGCHVPPLFASDRYAARGVGDLELDGGRVAVTEDEADRGAFRVPTLRNVRDTEPYFHDGSVVTLEEAVQHEVDQQVDDGASRPLDDAEVEALVRFVKKALQDTSASPERPESVPSGLPIPEDGFRIFR